MSATVCKTAAPPHAILLWADERSIYAQLPSQNGPYVAVFPRSEGGLSSALHTLGAMHAEHSGQPYLRPQCLPRDLLAKGLTLSALEQARDLLKKRGVI